MGRARARILTFLFFVFGLVAMRSIAGCSSTRDDEHLGTSRQLLITPSTTNGVIAATGNHEPGLTYIPSGGSDGAWGRWVGAAGNWDTQGNFNWLSWFYSTDGNGNSWTFQNQKEGTEFGCPGGSARACIPGGQACITSAACASVNPGSPRYGGTSLSSYCGCPSAPLSPSNNTAFMGWRGDPSITTVTDPNLTDGKRVIVSNVASSDGSPPGSGSAFQSDVIVALSTDGGLSFGNVQWVTTNSTNGGNVDMPFIFTNPISPYDTYVSWQQAGSSTGYLRKISYSKPPPPQTPVFSAGPVITIPKASNDTGQFPNRFNFAFGTLPGGCTSGQEGIFVVYTNRTSRCGQAGTAAPNGRQGLCQNPYPCSSGGAYWNLAIYDTGNGNWHGPWPIMTDPNWVDCAGFNPNSMPANIPWYSNTADPKIAVDPTNSRVWVAHTRVPLANGPIAVSVESALIQCPVSPPSFETVFTSPQPFGCAPNNNCDAWLPGIAMHRSGTNPRVGVYWYNTNNAANSQTALYASFQENLGLFSAPQQITAGGYPVSAATTWTVGGLDAYDYQTMGSSWSNASFLAVWAGDQRTMGTVIPGWNGGFEMDTLAAGGLPGTDWVGTGSFGVGIVDHHSGGRCAVLGDINPGGTSTLTQTFIAPPNASQVSIWYRMWCAGGGCPDSVVFDWAKVTLKDNVTQTTVNMLNNTYSVNAPWTQTPTATVIPGRSYTITLINHDDNYPGDAFYTYWDDLEFTIGVGTTTSMMSSLAK